MQAHKGLLYAISLGNWWKPRPPADFVSYPCPDKLGGILSESNEQKSLWAGNKARLSKVRAASGSQNWQRGSREFWNQQPTCLLMCHTLGFGVTKPYNEMSFWSGLEARHRFKCICSVLSLGCWDVTYGRWLTELCHSDREFNCPAPQGLLYPAREFHTYLQVTQEVQL